MQVILDRTISITTRLDEILVNDSDPNVRYAWLKQQIFSWFDDVRGLHAFEEAKINGGKWEIPGNPDTAKHKSALSILVRDGKLILETLASLGLTLLKKDRNFIGVGDLRASIENLEATKKALYGGYSIKQSEELLSKIFPGDS